MRRLPAGPALAVATVLVGCSSSPEAGPPLRGHVVLGHEVRTFQPCGEERELWVIPGPELRAAVDALRPTPYAPVYAEVRGEVGPPPETGFGADTSGQLTVTELLRAAPAAEGFGCAEDLSRIAFRAAGNEPFWRVGIGSDGIVVSRPGAEDLVLPPAAARRGSPPTPGWVYETRGPGGDGSALRLELRKEPCSDTMVGTRYSWRARVELDGERLEGCAWEGELAP